MKKRRVPVMLSDITASRYTGRIIRVPERRYTRKRGEHFVHVDVKITPEMAQRIAESVRRIAGCVLSREQGIY